MSTTPHSEEERAWRYKHEMWDLAKSSSDHTNLITEESFPKIYLYINGFGTLHVTHNLFHMWEHKYENIRKNCILKVESCSIIKSFPQYSCCLLFVLFCYLKRLFPSYTNHLFLVINSVPITK